MLRKLELFNLCHCRKPKLYGRSELMICLEVLKVGSSDTLARSRIFLECRTIETRVGLKLPKRGTDLVI